MKINECKDRYIFIWRHYLALCIFNFCNWGFDFNFNLGIMENLVHMSKKKKKNLVHEVLHVMRIAHIVSKSVTSYRLSYHDMQFIQFFD